MAAGGSEEPVACLPVAFIIQPELVSEPHSSRSEYKLISCDFSPRQLRRDGAFITVPLPLVNPRKIVFAETCLLVRAERQEGYIYEQEPIVRPSGTLFPNSQGRWTLTETLHSTSPDLQKLLEQAISAGPAMLCHAIIASSPLSSEFAKAGQGKSSERQVC